MSAASAHTLLASLIIVVYGVLTALGHDATPVLTLLVGQALGGGVQKAVGT